MVVRLFMCPQFIHNAWIIVLIMYKLLISISDGYLRSEISTWICFSLTHSSTFFCTRNVIQYHVHKTFCINNKNCILPFFMYINSTKSLFNVFLKYNFLRVFNDLQYYNNMFSNTVSFFTILTAFKGHLSVYRTNFSAHCITNGKFWNIFVSFSLSWFVSLFTRSYGQFVIVSRGFNTYVCCFVEQK